MISLIINGQEFEVPSGISILDACKTAGVIVPRFVIMKHYPLQETVGCV